MNPEHYTTLVACLADVADPRKRQGQRYEWLYLLTLMAAALVCGQRTVLAMSQWATHHGGELVASLKPKRRRIPSRTTLGRALRDITIEELERRVAEFVRTLDEADRASGSVRTQAGEWLRGQAVDGKSVRGASAHGEAVQLVSVVRHESGAVLAQGRIPAQGDEREVARALLKTLPLQGTLTTADALHTQRTTVEQIVAAHGDYLLVVKQNQPTLRQDICLAFGVLPPVGSWECEFWDYQSFSCQVRQGGRLETRLLESTTALNDYLTWPGVGQILRRTCHTVHRRTGQVQHQVHYAITSLSRERVTLAQVEQFWRWHWTIENCTHYVRDVSFGEDQAQLRSGHAPQALATLRNAVISLLRLEGWSYMPNAFRYFSQSVQLPLRLVGALET